MKLGRLILFPFRIVPEPSVFFVPNHSRVFIIRSLLNTKGLFTRIISVSVSGTVRV